MSWQKVGKEVPFNHLYVAGKYDFACSTSEDDFFFLFQKSLQEEIEALESRVESIQRVLSDLKVQLYAKFGNNINLEAEDS